MSGPLDDFSDAERKRPVQTGDAPLGCWFYGFWVLVFILGFGFGWSAAVVLIR